MSFTIRAQHTSKILFYQMTKFNTGPNQKYFEDDGMNVTKIEIRLGMIKNIVVKGEKEISISISNVKSNFSGSPKISFQVKTIHQNSASSIPT